MGLADGSRHHNVHRMLWDGSNDDWRPHLEADAERAGMDFNATMKDIEADPEKYDAVADRNANRQERRDRGPSVAVTGTRLGTEMPAAVPSARARSWRTRRGRH